MTPEATRSLEQEHEKALSLSAYRQHRIEELEEENARLRAEILTLQAAAMPQASAAPSAKERRRAST